MKQKRRSRVFEAKWFSFIIAAIVFSIYILLAVFTQIPNQLENLVLDMHFRLKTRQLRESWQEGAIREEHNLKISQDILIVGIDNRTLSEYGRWPFPRSRHANLVNAFSRLSDPLNRENSLFLDIFFIEPDDNTTNDALLVDAMKNSGKVALETVLKLADSKSDFDWERQDALFTQFGRIANIKGDWKGLITQYGAEAPLEAYTNSASTYGHANFIEDSDTIYRRQPMIIKYSSLKEQIRLDSLEPGFTVDGSNFERLVWEDRHGRDHDIETPISAKKLEALKEKMKNNAPLKIIDDDLDGIPDDSYYVLKLYKDEFVPSITLALALQYFHKDLTEIEVVVGSHILIKSPMVFNTETGNLEPYSIVIQPEVYDSEFNLVKDAVKRPIPEIRIPINSRGQMLVNFMGPHSSPDPEIISTFPVRSYAAYAGRDPGPDPDSWRRTLGVANKIVMVGAFSAGIADDEKPTPVGLMYGIELHANALNTIIMNNFVRELPLWLNMLIVAAFCFLIAFTSSRIPSIWAFFITTVSFIVYFFTVNTVFDHSSILLIFFMPAILSFIVFTSVVSYRVFTEERDKKHIRDTFGKYLSPKVVDELSQNPPELGGVDKELTVFFSDIRGYTALSETLSPQELVNHLNEYLSVMTDISIDYGATLDKYMGDAIMCFWGAPIAQEDHAVLACKCALKQMEALKELNLHWPESRRINIGIGLNSGIMTVGNMGSRMRMNYTLMGDNVNLGSRLEAINKEYGTSIIISEYTHALVKDRFVTRELDNIRVKGKNKPVVIYELLDCLESMDPPEMMQDRKSKRNG